MHSKRVHTNCPSPKSDANHHMKERFESLVEHLIQNGFFMEEAVEILERNLIERALVSTSGNRSAAAKLLGIHRNTLQRKTIEYQIGTSRVRRKPPRRVQSARRRAQAG
jgi:DNA-binding NtrC family response regulator